MILACQLQATLGTVGGWVHIIFFAFSSILIPYFRVILWKYSGLSSIELIEAFLTIFIFLFYSTETPEVVETPKETPVEKKEEETTNGAEAKNGDSNGSEAEAKNGDHENGKNGDSNGAEAKNGDHENGKNGDSNGAEAKNGDHENGKNGDHENGAEAKNGSDEATKRKAEETETESVPVSAEKIAKLAEATSEVKETPAEETA